MDAWKLNPKTQIPNPKTCPSLFEGKIPKSNDQNYKKRNALAHQIAMYKFWDLVLGISLGFGACNLGFI